MNAIEIAIEAIGSQSKLAKALNCTPQVVHNWLQRRNIPAERCIDIERASGGVVTCEQLRPDLADKWAYLRGTDKQAA